MPFTSKRIKKIKTITIQKTFLAIPIFFVRPGYCAEEARGYATINVVEPQMVNHFKTPPHTARPWVFWMWLRVNTSKEAITKDLEEMHAKGIEGAILYKYFNGDGPGTYKVIVEGINADGGLGRQVYKYQVEN